MHRKSITADDARTRSELQRWVQTSPGAGWFAYFRIYGPDAAAFDGTWRLPDFRRHG
ncbi:hypothetical protein [Nocardia sp. NPDC060249]|uniref:hypothetical protein n=1 Tax=Nocardia sp. NPDC060249 TaxID=3347082 RepID=UPI003663B45E